LENYGLLIGIMLILLVGMISVLIARQATASVAKFREEHHERFTRQDSE
jgi:hypothetical protein